MKRVVFGLLFVAAAVSLAAQNLSSTLQRDLSIVASGHYLDYSTLKAIKDPVALSLLRNCIYARHGYIFRDEQFAKFFSRFSWYVPKRRDASALLTAQDKSNLNEITYREAEVELNKLVSERSPHYKQPLAHHEEELIGIWQPYPINAAMWTDTYAFYGNRRVIYRTNQMDCSGRLQWKIGNWRIANGRLWIEYFALCTQVGGKMVPSAGSCGSKYTLVDSVYRVVQIHDPKARSLRISPKVAIDEPLPALKEPAILIDGEKFWKLRSNPADY